jgi:hypothetical protein
MTAIELERIGYRAALSVRCVDAVRGTVIADDIVATAWPAADPATRLVASRSPVSGLLGFGRLPGSRDLQLARSPGGRPLEWPPDPAPEPYVVKVVDPRGRYLPVVRLVPVPVPAPVDIPLHSGPARGGQSGWALVRGEVHDATSRAALGWSVVTVTAGPDSYPVVSDGLGRFLLVVPYPEALPPLAGSPPSGPGLSAMTWDMTIAVACEPGALTAAPGTEWDPIHGGSDPPGLDSILGQAAAPQRVGGQLTATSTATLAFGAPSVLTLSVEPS